MRGFFSSRFGGSLLERLIYIREKRRKDGRIFWRIFGIVKGRKVHEGGKGAIAADFVQVCFWLLWVF